MHLVAAIMTTWPGPGTTVDIHKINIPTSPDPENDPVVSSNYLSGDQDIYFVSILYTIYKIVQYRNIQCILTTMGGN